MSEKEDITGGSIGDPGSPPLLNTAKIHLYVEYQ